MNLLTLKHTNMKKILFAAVQIIIFIRTFFNQFNHIAISIFLVKQAIFIVRIHSPTIISA